MVYIPSGYDGKKQNTSDKTVFLNPDAKAARCADTQNHVDKTQIYTPAVRPARAHTPSFPSILHRVKTYTACAHTYPAQAPSHAYPRSFDDDAYADVPVERAHMSGATSYMLAVMLRFSAGLLSVYAWLLAGISLVSTFGFSIGRAFILDMILIAQAPIPRIFLGYMVVPSIFGGVIRGDLIILACIASCAEYLCLRCAWRLLHR